MAVNKKITVVKIVTTSVTHIDGFQELGHPSTHSAITIFPEIREVGCWESLFPHSSLLFARLEEFEGGGQLAATMCAWDMGGRRRHSDKEKDR